MKPIQKVAVLGAGTMGSRIAAHLANAGVATVLLDIVAPNLPPDAKPGARSQIAAAGLEGARKSKPAAFFEASLANLVTTGNFGDNLARVADADWIPGDWGYITNINSPAKGGTPGLEGENIIYTGTDQFWGHFSSGNTYRTLQQWFDDVKSWNGGAKTEKMRRRPTIGLS